METSQQGRQLAPEASVIENTVRIAQYKENPTELWYHLDVRIDDRLGNLDESCIDTIAEGTREYHPTEQP